MGSDPLEGGHIDESSLSSLHANMISCLEVYFSAMYTKHADMHACLSICWRACLNAVDVVQLFIGFSVHVTSVNNYFHEMLIFIKLHPIIF